MQKKSKSREAILNRWTIMFLISGLLAGLSIFWVLPYCEWQSPCTSVAPLVFGVIIPPFWFVVGLVFFVVARRLDKNSRPKAALAVRLSPLILMVVSGGYFLFAESRRQCVFDAIEDRDHGKLKNCLDSGATADSLTGSSRDFPALSYAVDRRDIKAIDLLLSYGASVDLYPPCHDNAPLRVLMRISKYASHDEIDEIRQKLLKAGAYHCR
jgi:hypothetical protein